jgi:hypothetical protein
VVGRGLHRVIQSEWPEHEDSPEPEPCARNVLAAHDVDLGDSHVSGRSSHRARGQSLVELALVLPIILLLFMAIFDFSRAIFAYNTVSNAARDGARIAIVDQQVIAGVSNAAQAAADQATGLGLDPTDANEVRVQYLMPDLSGPCPTSWGEWVGCVADVRVQYRYNPATPIIGGIIGPITVGSTTQLPIEKTNK